MKLKFLGVGGAFAPISKGNSNMLLESDSGKRLLIDFGTTAPYIYRDELGYDIRDIDGIWISHLHADHIGGMEFMAFARYFQPLKDAGNNVIKPKLYMIPELMQELWESSLKGGLESLEGKVMNLTDYFDCKCININSSFMWENYEFTPVQTIHVMSGYKFKHSYGLIIRSPIGYKTFITTDTQFAPYQLNTFYKDANIIFHDTETLPFKSNVHAHYNDLNTLPKEIKNKIWCYHYANKIDTYKEDGFAGFVDKFQEFSI